MFHLSISEPRWLISMDSNAKLPLGVQMLFHYDYLKMSWFFSFLSIICKFLRTRNDYPRTISYLWNLHLPNLYYSLYINLIVGLPIADLQMIIIRDSPKWQIPKMEFVNSCILIVCQTYKSLLSDIRHVVKITWI